MMIIILDSKDLIEHVDQSFSTKETQQLLGKRKYIREVNERYICE